MQKVEIDNELQTKQPVTWKLSDPGEATSSEANVSVERKPKPKSLSSAETQAESSRQPDVEDCEESKSRNSSGMFGPDCKRSTALSSQLLITWSEYATTT
jgi:hypothetical protein